MEQNGNAKLLRQAEKDILGILRTLEDNTNFEIGTVMVDWNNRRIDGVRIAVLLRKEDKP